MSGTGFIQWGWVRIGFGFALAVAGKKERWGRVRQEKKR